MASGSWKSLALVKGQAVATLVDDLKARDLFESVVIVAMGEFGRTPRINIDQKCNQLRARAVSVFHPGTIFPRECLRCAG